MSPVFDKAFGLERKIYSTWQEIHILEDLLKNFKDPHVLEFWNDGNVTFYKEDVQALLDSKNRRAEGLMDEMEKILNERKRADG